MNTRPDEFVDAARVGSREALEKLVSAIQDPIHRLATRMLVNPEDAREATQEILIIVVTKLATFEGRSAFMTWVYSIAANHLTTARKVRDRDPRLTFDIFREDLHDGLADDTAVSAEHHVLLNELRVSCTMAMLLCVDLDHRIAYVLGEILEFEHGEAAEALGISKANFRQRLSRARTQINAFTAEICGLVNPSAKCSCPRRLPAAIRLGRVGQPAASASFAVRHPMRKPAAARGRSPTS